jgi:hypothetical protein
VRPALSFALAVMAGASLGSHAESIPHLQAPDEPRPARFRESLTVPLYSSGRRHTPTSAPSQAKRRRKARRSR